MGAKLERNNKEKHGVCEGHWVDQKWTNLHVMKLCLFKWNYDRLMYVWEKWVDNVFYMREFKENSYPLLFCIVWQNESTNEFGVLELKWFEII